MAGDPFEQSCEPGEPGQAGGRPASSRLPPSSGRRSVDRVRSTLLKGLSALGLGRFARSWPDPESRAIAALRPATPTAHRPIRLYAVGDTLLGSESQPALDAHGYGFPFERLRGVIDRDGLLVGNLEGPITGETVPVSPRKSCVLKQQPPVAAALRDFGFDVLCLANNHALDYGPQGLADTRRALDAAGLLHFGAGADLEQALQGCVVQRDGLRIGFLGFMQWWQVYDESYRFYARDTAPGVAAMMLPAFHAAMRRMRPQVDVLVVSFHWGPDHADVTREQREWGLRAVHSGADLVLGHHPHVVQGVEVVAGVPIVYSLGNFAFGVGGHFARLPPAWHYGWIAEVTIENSRVTGLELIPIATDNDTVRYQPVVADAADLAETLRAVNRKFGAPVEIVDGRARLRIPPGRR